MDEERHVDPSRPATWDGTPEPPAGGSDAPWRGNGAHHPGGTHASNGSGGYSYAVPATPPGFTPSAPPEGYESQGYESQGYQPADYESRRYEPREYEPQGHAPRGHSQGYEPQGYEPQGYESQGYGSQHYQPQGYEYPPQDHPQHGFRPGAQAVPAPRVPEAGSTQTWSSAAAAPEPAAEPLALLANRQAPAPERYPNVLPPRYADPEPAPASPPAERAPQQPQPPSAGLGDETPVGGVSIIEPPPRRETGRHSAPTSPVPPVAPAAAPSPYPERPEAGPFGGQTTDYPGQATDYPGQPTDYPGQAPAAAPPAPPPPATPVEPEPRAGLPQRVPSEPDVPEVPETGPGSRERWTARELAWIADRLRHDEVPQEPVERLDVDAIVEAVRGVPGVLSASVKANPSGVHRLRLELADDADPGQVSRVVARMLEERMGLSAASQLAPTAGSAPAPPAPTAPAPAAPPDPPRATAAAPSTAPPAPPAAPPKPPAPPSPAATEPPPAASEPAPVARRRPADRPAPAAAPAAPASEKPPAPAGPTAAPGRGAAARDASRPATPSPAGGTGPEQVVPEAVSKPLPTQSSTPRVVIDHVRVSSVGLDATVEVLLTAGDRRSRGEATGPAVDSYVIRLAAVATANAIDDLLRQCPEPASQLAGALPDTTDPSGSRCFVEHTGVVQFGETEVAVVVVLLLVCGGWVEQLSGSALVDGDPRQAMVRATLGAVNRRLEALLA